MSELTSGLLDDAQSLVREQLDSVWRQQLERLQEVLTAWPLEMERTLQGASADLVTRIEQRYRAAFEQCVQEAARKARTEATAELAGTLSRSLRRLRSAKDEAACGQALLDATRGFCDRAALFTVRTGSVHLEGTRNISREGNLDGIPISAAPAFRAAVESSDTIVAMRTNGEMSDLIASYFGEEASGRFHLFPINVRGQVAALLYADGKETQVDSLDLLAGAAGAVLESRTRISAQTADLINIDSLQKQTEAPSWSALTQADRELHLKGQRFARVQVANLRLYKSGVVKIGRAEGNLYTSLKEEIDSARGMFRRDFIAKSKTMVDYFHVELVRTLANDDVTLLGPDYPGPLA